MSRRKRITGLVIVLMLLGMTGCGKTENADNIVRLGVYTGGADHFQAIIAQEQGFFEKQGLQVKVTQFASGINTVDAIVTGQEDVGLITDYAGINRIGSTKEECNIKIIARYTTSDDYWTLFVNPELVTTIEDLGKQGIATIPGTFLDYCNAVVYETANVPKEEQKMINVDSEQTALGILSNGEAAACWISNAAVSKAEDIGLSPFLTMEDLDLSVDAYYVASDSFLEEREDLAEAFLAAIADTQKWIAENPEETARIIEDKIHVPAEQVLATLKSNDLVLDFDEKSIAHLNKIKEWAIGAGNFEGDFEIADFVNTKVLEQYK